MTHEQAKALIRAADALPKHLGDNYTFYQGAPCCAVGHLAAPLLPETPRGPTVLTGDLEVRVAYDLDTDAIIAANDEAASPGRRRGRVLTAIAKQVKAAGHDPAALRAEIAAEAAR